MYVTQRLWYIDFCVCLRITRKLWKLLSDYYGVTEKKSIYDHNIKGMETNLELGCVCKRKPEIRNEAMKIEIE